MLERFDETGADKLAPNDPAGPSWSDHGRGRVFGL